MAATKISHPLSSKKASIESRSSFLQLLLVVGTVVIVAGAVFTFMSSSKSQTATTTNSGIVMEEIAREGKFTTHVDTEKQFPQLQFSHEFHPSTKENIQDLSKSADIVLLLFYRRFNEIQTKEDVKKWERVANFFSKEPGMECTLVDCDVSSACSDFGAPGFPSVVLFFYGEYQDYLVGARDPRKIIDFADERLQARTASLSTSVEEGAVEKEEREAIYSGHNGK